MLQFRNGTDVAMLNGTRTSSSRRSSTTSRMSDLHRAGLRASSPRTSRVLAEEDGADPRHRGGRAGARSTHVRPREISRSFLGHGVSQHIDGTDNARCLIALSLITGQIWPPRTGRHPPAGQNNVQGAFDAASSRCLRCTSRWRTLRSCEYEAAGRDAHRREAQNVVEIMDVVHADESRGCTSMARTATSDPDLTMRRGGAWRFSILSRVTPRS